MRGNTDFALEMRRRVKEQLKKIGGMEFYDVNFLILTTSPLRNAVYRKVAAR